MDACLYPSVCCKPSWVCAAVCMAHVQLPRTASKGCYFPQAPLQHPLSLVPLLLSAPWLLLASSHSPLLLPALFLPATAAAAHACHSALDVAQYLKLLLLDASFSVFSFADIFDTSSRKSLRSSTSLVAKLVVAIWHSPV